MRSLRLVRVFVVLTVSVAALRGWGCVDSRLCRRVAPGRTFSVGDTDISELVTRWKTRYGRDAAGTYPIVRTSSRPGGAIRTVYAESDYYGAFGRCFGREASGVSPLGFCTTPLPTTEQR